MILDLPTDLIARVSRRLAETSAAAASPFTGTEQIQDWGGEWWEYDITLAQQLGRDGRRLSAFFAQLGGKRGRFLMRDPSIENPPVELRRNLLTFTEQFDNGAWSDTNISLTATADPSPITGVDFWRMESTSDATAVKNLFQNGAIVAGNIYTATLYVLADEVQYIMFHSDRRFTSNDSAAGRRAVIDLATGDVARFQNADFSDLVAQTELLPGGVVKITVTATAYASGTGSLMRWHLKSSSGDGNSSPAPIGDGLFIAAPQVEIDGPTSYQFVEDGTEFDGVKVAGAGQTGNSLDVTGLVGDPLQAGDFFSIGSGAETRLHQLTQDVVVTDNAGTLHFVPALRVSPLNGAAVEVHDPKVLLRLRDSVPVGITPGDKFNVTFSAREAI